MLLALASFALLAARQAAAHTIAHDGCLDGTYYVADTTQLMRRFEALTFCQGQGGGLFSANSLAEAEFVEDHVLTFFWGDCSPLAVNEQVLWSSGRLVAGEWTWTPGGPSVQAELWCPGEPNNFNDLGEEYATIGIPHVGLAQFCLNDSLQKQRAYPLCEIPNSPKCA